MNDLPFAEMFSGIGGFRLGLERSGWRCVWANDIDKYANTVYKKKFGDGELVEGDIRQVDARQIPRHTLLTAGFPCQAFSVAGKRKATSEARGTLFWHIYRVAKVKRPKLLLLENVKGILSSDSGRTFAIILRLLEELGYDVEWQVLNSKHFGVPQNRERVFVVGHLRGDSTRQIFPIGQVASIAHGTRKEAQTEGTRVRVANSLNVGGSGRERNLIANTLSNRYYKDGSENLVASALIQSQGREPHIETREDSISHALKGKGGWEGNFMVLMDNKGGNIKKRLRETNREAWCLGGSQTVVGDRVRVRRLTPTECERLQGFPDGWTEGVSDTQRYKLLGNAVTVNVVEFLGKKLRECLEVEVPVK